jgi:hypothetical protein
MVNPGINEIWKYIEFIPYEECRRIRATKVYDIERRDDWKDNKYIDRNDHIYDDAGIYQQKEREKMHLSEEKE